MSRKRRDFNYAYHCLEKWVIWNSEHNGYPARSPILKFGEAMAFPTESSIPTGVEPFDRDVERANTVLAMMNCSSGKSAERAHLLKVVTAGRKEGESIQSAIDNLGINIDKRAFHDAIEEFDIRLETLIYKV